ncbi:hypothetical protein [Rubritalea tangerina]|uniref:hypothetical protein n=1 Tax=Rubritalea tangerina TaxID=430798 RepID=UPI0036200AF6
MLARWSSKISSVEQDAAPNRSPRLTSALLSRNSNLNPLSKLSGQVRGWCALRSVRYKYEKNLYIDTKSNHSSHYWSVLEYKLYNSNPNIPVCSYGYWRISNR